MDPSPDDPTVSEATVGALFGRVDELLAASMADAHLSRNERRDLRALIAALPGDVASTEVRRRAFAAASAAIADPARGAAALEWLHDVVELLDARATAESKPARSNGVAEAHFSPGHGCRIRITQLLNTARQSVDICVFTITDDRISQAILAAHGRGVGLRILTDNEKAEDLGSDIARFREAGIPVCIDRSQAHMHHKFAIFDGGLLLTGSYNWTRGAAEENEENFVLSSDARHVGPFQSVFDRLWERLHATGQC